MATYESDTLIQTKDKSGNLTIHYPVTRAENVLMSDDSSVEEAIAAKAASDLSNVDTSVLEELFNTYGGSGGLSIVAAASDDGVAYTATVEDVTELTAGMTLIFIPGKTSASTAPTLNVNGLGAKTIKRRLSGLSSTLTSGNTNNWLFLNKPQIMTYDGTYWVVMNQAKPSATDLYGKVSVQNGGWYVNSDTTDDDKAEALESLIEIGVTPEGIGAAPAYTYSTTDLTAGTSALETGKMYLVYE